LKNTLFIFFIFAELEDVRIALKGSPKVRQEAKNNASNV